MQIYQFKYQMPKISFKSNEEKINEKELLVEYRKGNIDLRSINPKTKETMFQTFVRKNLLEVIKYVTTKPKERTDVLNYAPYGKTPLDSATSDEMRNVLRQRGAKFSSELSQQTLQADAKSVAAQVFVSDPIKVKPADMKPVTTLRPEIKKEVKTESKAEKPVKVKKEKQLEPQPVKKEKMAKVAEKVKLQKVDFFDSFEEVEEKVLEPVIENKPVQQNALVKVGQVEENVPTVIPEEVPVEAPQKVELKELKIPSSYKNYQLVQIAQSDPQLLDEVIGYGAQKTELKENIVVPMTEQVANVTLKANNIDIPNGILFVTNQNVNGLIKALINEINVPALQIFQPSELKPMLGDIQTNFKDNNQKTVVLIRGFDKFFTTGPNCALDENNFMLTAENCGSNGALILATAECKDQINQGFMKSGIFDKVLEIKAPEFPQRREYLAQYMNGKHLFSELNKPEILDELAEKTEAFSYEDIEKVLEESARTTVSNKKESISPADIKLELAEFTKAAGIVPVDDYNKTTMYDTPEFKRVPVVEGEMMRLDELGGMPEVKEKLKNLYIEPLKNIDKLKAELGANAMPDGAIFFGPAGNGKTLTAQVLARELGLPFYETKLGDIGSSYVHETSRNLTRIANQLNEKYKKTGEMSVWFLDEFDSLGEARGDHSASHKQEVTDTLLQLFNNPQKKGYILVAATNDLEGIDPALRRRGRLGNWIQFSNPDDAARQDVIRKTLAKTSSTKHLSKDPEFLKKASKEFDGSSMSSITSVLTDAKRTNILTGKDFDICIKECFDEHNKHLMGEFCNKAGLKQHEYNEWDFQTLDELGGMEDVKEALQENIIDIWDPEVRQMLLMNKRSLPGGVILEGPPGTGKTTIVETLARQMGVPLYKMNYSQKGNEYIHGVSRNVTDIFERLKLEAKIIKKPIMLFFDEAEKFFPRGAERHQIEEVNTYKELMNTAAAAGLILVAATNHINLVNQEIIGNPRRMGTIIHVGNPDELSRLGLFKKLLGDLPILKGNLMEEHYKELSKLTEGFSIGNIADTIDKVITQAIKKKQNIEPETIIKAFAKKL